MPVKGSMGRIVVERRDRLARVGSECVEAAVWGSGRKLAVVDRGEVDSELVRNMTEMLTSSCARLYGRRSARTGAARALRRAAERV
jgi:putative resolvase